MKYVAIPYVVYSCLLSTMFIVMLIHSQNWRWEPDYLLLGLMFSFILVSFVVGVLLIMRYFASLQKRGFHVTLLILLVLQACLFACAVFFIPNDGDMWNYYPFGLPLILAVLFIYDVAKALPGTGAK